jgi:hypothetical protein
VGTPVLLSCWLHRSTCDLPHEQLLVSLGAGGGSFIVRSCWAGIVAVAVAPSLPLPSLPLWCCCPCCCSAVIIVPVIILLSSCPCWSWSWSSHRHSLLIGSCHHGLLPVSTFVPLLVLVLVVPLSFSSHWQLSSWSAPCFHFRAPAGPGPGHPVIILFSLAVVVMVCSLFVVLGSSCHYKIDRTYN